MSSITWSRLTPRRFEELALDYAEEQYPDYRWVLTPETGDGNKDVVAVVQREVMGGHASEQYWVEAKFSKRAAPLRKERVDATLVSGFIAGNVRKIVVITNSPVPESCVLRATQFYDRPFRQLYDDGRPQLVTFVEGSMLEQWLLRTPEIHRRYFGATAPDGFTLTPPDLVIRSFSLYRSTDFRRGLFKQVRGLRTDESYVAHIQLSSRRHTAVNVIPPENAPITLYPDIGADVTKPLRLEPGLNSVTLLAKPTEPGVYDRWEFSVTDDRGVTASVKAPVIVVDDYFAPEFRYPAQQDITNTATRRLHRLYERGEGAAILITAPGGIGKTHIIDAVEQSIPIHADQLRLSFSDRDDYNAKLVCQLLLFTICGVARDVTAEQIVRSFRRAIPFSRATLNGIVNGATDGATAAATVRHLGVTGDDFLILPDAVGSARVVILDDVHKLRAHSAAIVARVLAEISLTEVNLVALATARNGEFESKPLQATLADVAHECRLMAMTAEDVNRNFRSIFRVQFDLPRHTAEMVASSTLLARYFMREFHAASGRPDSAAETAVRANKIIQGAGQVLSRALSGRLRAARRWWPLLDIIVAVETGVAFDALAKRFTAGAIGAIVDAELASVRNGEVVPYHDLVAAEYRRLRKNVYTPAVGRFLSGYIRRRAAATSDLLPTLLRCGVQFEVEYLKGATEHARRLVQEKSYAGALPLLEAIVQIVERRGAERSALTPKQIVETFFSYAACVDHCRSTLDAAHLYEAAAGLGERLLRDPRDRGLIYESRAEQFNCAFWTLQTKGLFAEIAAFLRELDLAAETFPSLLEDDRFKRAYLTALNRQMMVAFVTDMDADGTILFERNIEVAARLAKPNYVGYCLLDYGKCLYATSIDDALSFIKRAEALFDSLGDQKRRLLLSRSELAFLRSMREVVSVEPLVSAVDLLRAEGYHSEYRKGLLKIAACLVRRGNTIAAAGYLKDVLDTATSEINDRGFAAIANIEAAIACADNDIDTMRQASQRQLQYLERAGRSYRSVAQHNLRLRQRTTIRWSFEATAEAFVLESRLW